MKKKKMKTDTKSQIGCGEMTKAFTFNVRVEDAVAGSAPMTEQECIDYIVMRLEAQSVIRVTSIVRDY
jgi:hypothetical protein